MRKFDIFIKKPRARKWQYLKSIIAKDIKSFVYIEAHSNCGCRLKVLPSIITV